MQRLTRIVGAVVVALAITVLTACSWFSSVSCSGATEEGLLAQLLTQSGTTGGAIIAASFGNDQLGAVLGILSLADPASGAPLARNLKALVSGGVSAFDVRGVITKEKKSRKSVVCSADLLWAGAN